MTDLQPQGPDDTRADPAPARVKFGRFLIPLAVIAGIVAFQGVTSRKHDEAQLAQWTRERAAPTVSVVAPTHPTGTRMLTLPGDVDAFYNASVHAQVSGYVQQWMKDIGADVRQGETLAVIDTPTLDQQIEQAKEELSKAKANLEFAKTTAERWNSLRASAAVSQQAADEKVSDAKAREADVAAAAANVQQLKASKAFANIVAPFDGVVTARNIDIGSLVSDSSGPQSTLFVVADTHEMRVYVAVPQNYEADIKVGMHATLKLPEYPDRTFDAVVATSSRAISKSSRSLLVELHADNPDRLLRPGAFAQVLFQLPESPTALVVPAGALLFRGADVQVATVDANSRIRMKPVEIAKDFGATVEIASGLSPTDRIVAAPLDSIADGDEVRVKEEAVAKSDEKSDVDPKSGVKGGTE